MNSASLIAIDWGTTSFRAYLLDSTGEILDAKTSPMGILKVRQQHFEEALEAQIGQWLDAAPGLDLIASGMIGSRQGWKEIPYLSGSVGLSELAGALEKIPLRRGSFFWIVPGIEITDAYGIPDVMRGEETQVLGSVGDAQEIFVLPGTHSKWVLCEQERIVWFSTFMTGELYQILKDYSILGKLFEGELAHRPSFIKGIKNSQLNQFSGLLHNLFSTRTLGLSSQINSEYLASYLSGLLIGSELQEAKKCLEQQGNSEFSQIKLIGRTELVSLYQIAFETLWNCQNSVLDENTVVQGLYKIALQSRMNL